MFWFVVSVLSQNCSDVSEWLFNCSIDATPPYTIQCPSSGFLEVGCVPLVDCDGNRSALIRCYPTDGKSPATALCLSVVLGWTGADRFYLGYTTIGLFKLFTGGFFGLGWYLDIFMIALRIAKPARGEVYRFMPGANFQVRLPGPGYF
jgi:hypothetical protein